MKRRSSLWLRPACAPALACLLMMFLWRPGTALAQSEGGDRGPERCAECHVDEADVWSTSPHAGALDSITEALQVACASPADSGQCVCLQCHAPEAVGQGVHGASHGGVTCEACHGGYRDGHPTSATMTLVSDSTPCMTCHVDTCAEWQTSAHGQANVQCIGCHLVHEQELRSDGSALCLSCHQAPAESGMHQAHVQADVVCESCHFSHQEPTASAAGGELMLISGGGAIPSHSLAVDTLVDCVTCHTSRAFHVSSNATAPAVSDEEVSWLKEELRSAQAGARSLRTLSFATLGIGLGAGGVLGVLLMLMVGYLFRGRGR